MRTVWFENELRVASRNTIIDILLRKSARADRFWSWAEKFNPARLWRRDEPTA
jgi:hypothetical protein